MKGMGIGNRGEEESMRGRKKEETENVDEKRKGMRWDAMRWDEMEGWESNRDEKRREKKREREREKGERPF